MALSGEKARALLEEQHVRGWMQARRTGLQRVSGGAREAGEWLLKPVWHGGKGERKVAEELDRLRSTEREALFELLHPRLGSHLERMWQMSLRLPYQTVLVPPFRTREPLVTLDARWARLRYVSQALLEHDVDALWVARWAPYLSDFSGGVDALGTLLAAVLEGGGNEADAVYDALIASAEGSDEIGTFGRHVTRALLTASRAEGWQYIERLLLAAQRQEGLRQVILETVDQAHPAAFRRMLALILAEDLGRLSSVVRALDVWFGYGWSSAAPAGRSPKGVADTIELVLRFLGDGDARDSAIERGSPTEVSLALWAEAYDEAVPTVAKAAALLSDPDPERRFVAVDHLVRVGLSTGIAAVVPALNDDDLRVAARALDAVQGWEYYPKTAPGETFERLEKLFERVNGRTVELPPIVWPWTGRKLERSTIGRALLAHVGGRPIERLLPHVSAMDSWNRQAVAEKLARRKRLNNEERRALLSLAIDQSATVRDAVLRAVGKIDVNEEEALQLERELRRRPGDLRRLLVTLLLRRDDRAVLASIDRLLGSTDLQQRLGGLELLRQLVQENRSTGAARERARAYRDTRVTLSEVETVQLDAIAGPAAAETAETATGRASTPATLDDALGLLVGQKRSLPTIPSILPVRFETAAVASAIRSLDELVHEHRSDPIQVTNWMATVERVPLGEADWLFPTVGGVPAAPNERSGRPNLEELPLREVWTRWADERPLQARDPDGLELVRALALVMRDLDDTRTGKGRKRRLTIDSLRYPAVVRALLEWLVLAQPPEGTSQLVIDSLETCAAAYWPEATAATDDREWFRVVGLKRADVPGPTAYVDLASALRPDGTIWSADHERRLWGLLRFLDEPWFGQTRTDNREQTKSARVTAFADRISLLVRAAKEAGAAAQQRSTSAEATDPDSDKAMADGLGSGETYAKPTRRWRRRPRRDHVVAAFLANVATEGDVIDQLIGARTAKWHDAFEDLAELSRRRPRGAAAEPRLATTVQRVRERIIEVELTRGEAPTAATKPALALNYSGGLDVLVPLLRALGRDAFVRGWSYDGESRSVVFSRLIRASWPLATDTADVFAAHVGRAGIRQKRLVELGVFAPQWATHVEKAVGWPGLADAIWWMHAHTKDDQWTVDHEVKQAWAAEVAERTPLPARDLVDGAVDTEWFWRVFECLGSDRWVVLDGAAKYGSSAAGHSRARLFASALRGEIDAQTLRARITEKRNKDDVRAMGLLPLPEGVSDSERDELLLDRYSFLHEFLRLGREFGAMRRASEKRAVEIGLENLARTAGYGDPLRLSWAMEGRGVADLADGPRTVTRGDLQLSLTIDENGSPVVTSHREGKVLKAVPAAVKKDPEVVALRARATELRKRASRIRVSLEGSMVGGDRFSGAELREHARHPLLWPQLRRLVLVSEEGNLAGYATAEGRALIGPTGREQAVGVKDCFRAAHPLDLLESGTWSEWQRDVFAREVVQPFKQVFRELYVLTEGEVDETGTASRRYAGHQVQPAKALAILGSRGWVNHPEEGLRRTFHNARITTWLEFLEPFFTPADVENAAIETVRFSRSGEWKPIAVADVPPRVFSEAMRDIDLVVSVAHAGGVDPEASASTVEMRAAVVAETARLLALENVAIDGVRVIVRGEMAEYSVHLGSGLVHLRPGGAMFIVPVHGQHRGRLFLPFADDDPKTAEVVSKVLLLARDREIRDPSILEQIRSRAK